MKKLVLVVCILFGIQSATAQSETEAIKQTLMKYINGSTGGKPQLLKDVFHPELNLYYVRKDALKIWSGKAYIEDAKEGKPTGEGGKILAIDFENNAAMAKVEIFNPKRPYKYIDYFMLLKVKGKWMIIHKMFTKKV